MAAGYMTLLIEEIEERVAARTIPMKDRSNPLEVMTEQKFIKNFRVNKELAIYLIDNLKGELRHERIPPCITVLAALNFYATGSYQTSVAGELDISQPTVCRSIEEVTKAIKKILLHQIIQFPHVQEQQQIKQKIFDRYGVPGVIGTIDCTHIEMIQPKQQPTDHGNISRSIMYLDRKGHYTLNVQLIGDHNLKIRSITARYPGSVHDAFIWKFCPVRRYLEHRYNRDNSSSSWLLGDSGYPLEPWLLTPFPDPNPGTIEEAFNRKHASARSTIEPINGILKSRFRCLSRFRVLHYAPTKSSLITNACAVLHNLCIHYRLDLDEHEPLHPDDLTPVYTTCDATDSNLFSVAKRIRYRVAVGM